MVSKHFEANVRLRRMKDLYKTITYVVHDSAGISYPHETEVKISFCPEIVLPKYIHSFVHNLNFSCKDNNFRL